MAVDPDDACPRGAGHTHVRMARALTHHRCRAHAPCSPHACLGEHARHRHGEGSGPISHTPLGSTPEPDRLRVRRRHPPCAARRDGLSGGHPGAAQPLPRSAWRTAPGPQPAAAMPRPSTMRRSWHGPTGLCTATSCRWARTSPCFGPPVMSPRLPPRSSSAGTAKSKTIHFTQPGFQARTGHFTQVVWKASQALGIGMAQAGDGTWYIVGHYSPPGNITGHFPANVLPPTP